MFDEKGDKNMGEYIRKILQFDQIVDENCINKKYCDEIENKKVFFIDKRNKLLCNELSSLLHNIEGVHKIYYKNELKFQYIVFSGDLYSLIYSLSSLFNHGSEDGLYIKQNLKEMTMIIRKRNLNFTCGSVTRYCMDVFNALGIETTYFRFQNNSAKLGSSHVMLEIYVDGKPILCDLDTGSLFKYGNDFMSFNSLVTMGFNDEIDIIKLNSSKRHTFFGSDRHDKIFYSENGKRQFYKEVFSSKYITFGLRTKNGIMFISLYDSKSGAKMRAEAMKALLGRIRSGAIDKETARAAFKRVLQQATTS